MKMNDHQQVYLVQDEGYAPTAIFRSGRELVRAFKLERFFSHFEDCDQNVLSRRSVEQTLKSGERVFAISMLPGERGRRVEDTIHPMPANVLDSPAYTALRLPYETDRLHSQGALTFKKK